MNQENIIGPCLVASKISKFYKILHHIESLNTSNVYGSTNVCFCHPSHARTTKDTTKESKLTHRKGRRYLFPCHLDSQLEIQGYITHPMNKLEYRSRKSSGERTEHKNQISNCLCQLTRNKDKRYPKKNNRNRLRKNGRCTASAQTRTNKVITIWSLIWYIKNPNQQNILLSSQPRSSNHRSTPPNPK